MSILWHQYRNALWMYQNSANLICTIPGICHNALDGPHSQQQWVVEGKVSPVMWSLRGRRHISKFTCLLRIWRCKPEVYHFFSLNNDHANINGSFFPKPWTIDVLRLFFVLAICFHLFPETSPKIPQLFSWGSKGTPTPNASPLLKLGPKKMVAIHNLFILRPNKFPWEISRPIFAYHPTHQLVRTSVSNGNGAWPSGTEIQEFIGKSIGSKVQPSNPTHRGEFERGESWWSEKRWQSWSIGKKEVYLYIYIDIIYIVESWCLVQMLYIQLLPIYISFFVLGRISERWMSIGMYMWIISIVFTNEVS